MRGVAPDPEIQRKHFGIGVCRHASLRPDDCGLDFLDGGNEFRS